MARNKPKSGISKNLLIIGVVLVALILAVVAYGYSVSQKNKQLAEKAAAYAAQEDVRAQVAAIYEAERKRKMDRQQAAWAAKSDAITNSQPVKSAARSSNPALDEITNQRMARQWVEARLKDKSSAEFRNQKGFCGEVNAKNSYGGYSGFERFIAANESMVVQEKDMAIGEFDKAWSQACN